MSEMENGEMMDNVVVLVDQDGKEMEFEYLDTIEYEGANYAVLVPLEEDDEEEAGSVLIMKIIPDENGDDLLDMVEDEAVLDAVFEIFRENNSDDFEFID